MNKRIWSIRRDSEAVSPIIGTILLVGITIVLAATLYVMVFGFGDSSSNKPPEATFTKTSITNGFKFTFTPFSKDTPWSDVYIVLSDGTNTITFNNLTTEQMSTGLPVTRSLGHQQLVPLNIFMNATDLAGNGFVNQGDTFTLTTSGGEFSNNVTYTVYLMHKPSGSQISFMDFLGD